MSDRLQELAVFVRTAESGSFSRAGRELGLSQPSVSRIIGELEARLGVKLLLRTTRRITLTHEGSAFLEDCQRLLADFANAEASVSAGGVNRDGTSILGFSGFVSLTLNTSDQPDTIKVTSTTAGLATTATAVPATAATTTAAVDVGWAASVVAVAARAVATGRPGMAGVGAGCTTGRLRTALGGR